MEVAEKIDCLRDYYRNRFSTSELRKVIGLQDFSCREFAFQLQNTGFIRNISFERPGELTRWLKEDTPLSAYVGAVYDRPLSNEYRIQEAKWCYRELVFDIDLNDYDDVRTCGCKGKGQICQKCWPLLHPVVLMLDQTFERDFGYEVTWAYSGNRGIHAWIRGSHADDLSRNQRRAIVDYLSMVRKGRLLLLRSGDRRLELPTYIHNRIMRLVVKIALNLASKEELIQAGFTKDMTKQILSYRVSQEGISNPRFQRLTTGVQNREQILRKILERWYPRFDENVTVDIRRVLRIPGSIHGSTGKACRLLREDELIPNFIFDPEEEPSVFGQG